MVSHQSFERYRVERDACLDSVLRLEAQLPFLALLKILDLVLNVCQQCVHPRVRIDADRLDVAARNRHRRLRADLLGWCREPCRALALGRAVRRRILAAHPHLDALHRRAHLLLRCRCLHDQRRCHMFQQLLAHSDPSILRLL